MDLSEEATRSFKNGNVNKKVFITVHEKKIKYMQ